MPSLVYPSRQVVADRYIMSLNPILYLPLWKRDGSQFISEDAYGHLCTVTGATWGSQGRIFDGNDYITLSAFGLTAPLLSLEFWVSVTGHATNQSTLIGDNAQSNTVGFLYPYRVQNVNTLGWAYTNGAAIAYVNVFNFFTGFDATLIHIGITVNYTTGAMVFYRNGAQFATATMTTPVFPDTSRARYLGAYAPATLMIPNATFGEVRIYNPRILSAGEIQRLYELTKWRYQ